MFCPSALKEGGLGRVALPSPPLFRDGRYCNENPAGGQNRALRLRSVAWYYRPRLSKRSKPPPDGEKMQSTSADSILKRHATRNFWLNILDGMAFVFGISMVSRLTVLPLFVSRLSDERW